VVQEQSVAAPQGGTIGKMMISRGRRSFGLILLRTLKAPQIEEEFQRFSEPEYRFLERYGSLGASLVEAQEISQEIISANGRVLDLQSH
jgi:hypothetical protein